jgi:predicted nucleic acid-binding protein
MRNVLSVGKAFFDTNVLLYMNSPADLRKQARAQELFDHHMGLGSIVLSTQVVQEFYTVGSRKLAFSRQYLKEAVTKFLALPLVLLGPSHILRAIENEERYQISFGDGLILAAAESAGAEVLFTEDLNDGQQYGEVLVRNPFRTGEDSKAG